MEGETKNLRANDKFAGPKGSSSSPRSAAEPFEEPLVINVENLYDRPPSSRMLDTPKLLLLWVFVGIGFLVFIDLSIWLMSDLGLIR